MSVGISYTGVDGKTTKFRSDDSRLAVERLSRIPGYAGGEADQIAAALAPGWRERHKARAAQFANRQPFVGRPSGEKFISPSGVVSRIPRVAKVEVKDGKVTTTTQDEFVSEGGNVVGVGNRRTESVGKIEDTKVVSGSVKVALGFRYDEHTHELLQIDGELFFKEGKLSTRKTGESVITTAVSEGIWTEIE